MKKTSTYQAVSCTMHSELELSIMQGKHLQLQFTRNGEILSLAIKPLDIISRKGQGEFLLAVDASDQPLEIRLDTIGNFHVL